MDYTDSILDALRLQGDPSADALMHELIEHGEVEHVSALLGSLLSSDAVVPQEFPPRVQAWLDANSRLPEGVDMERMTRAAAHFAKHAFSYAVVLSTSSLLEAYAARRGVEVLTFTHRLDYDTKRRIAETTQFYLNVQSPHVFEEGGQGIANILKIRLLHATVRNLILGSKRWDAKDRGIPICQEDMLGTMLTFSGVIIRDLPKLGITLTAEQAEDLVYYWCVVGQVLGIDPAWMPRGVEDATALGERIAERHHEPSESGSRMAKSLMEFMQSMMPADLFDSMVPVLLRTMAGDKVCDILGLPDHHLRHLSAADRLGREFLIPLNLAGRSLLAGGALVLNGGHHSSFSLPTSLDLHLEEHHGGWRDAVHTLMSYVHR